MLLEMAISDAYGAGMEYVSKDLVAEHNTLKGYVSHPRHGQKPGTYTDDTQMALAIAESMVAAQEWSREILAQKFVDVFKRDPRKGYSQRFYWFLREVKDGAEFLARIDPRSAKSGAAMRAPPLGLYPVIADVLERAKIQAIVTHRTPEGIASAQAAALAVHYLAYGLGPKAGLGRFLGREITFDYGWHKPWRGKVGPSGLEAVHAAVYVLSRAETLTGVLRAAVAFTGDVDTVAAIAMAAAATSDHYLWDLPPVLVAGLEQGPFGADYLRKTDRVLAKKFGKPRKDVVVPLGGPRFVA